MITVFPFDTAPPELKALSDNGGDEDWLAIVPPELRGRYLGWLERIDTCQEPQIVEHPTKAGWQVWIGSHA